MTQPAPAPLRDRRLTDEARFPAPFVDPRRRRSRHAAHAVAAALCVLALAAAPTRAAQYPGFMNNMVTDSSAVFTIPGLHPPLYQMKKKDPTFRTGITRVSGNYVWSDRIGVGEMNAWLMRFWLYF